MDERIAELYGVPLDEFVKTRNELAASLKAAGDSTAAAEVRALRKPSVPAWAINQLARGTPEAIAELVSVGERLAEAHSGVLAGGDAGELHQSRAAERAAVTALVEQAERILQDAGFAPNSDRRERVADTLYAMAADPEARAAVVEGRLTEERQRVGFAEGLGTAPIPRAVKPAPRVIEDPGALRSEAEQAVARALEARALADRLSAEEHEAEEQAEQARARANESRRQAERARRDADRAQRDAEEAARRLSASGASADDILGPLSGA